MRVSWLLHRPFSSLALVSQKKNLLSVLELLPFPFPLSSQCLWLLLLPQLLAPYPLRRCLRELNENGDDAVEPAVWPQTALSLTVQHYLVPLLPLSKLLPLPQVLQILLRQRGFRQREWLEQQQRMLLVPQEQHPLAGQM